MKKSELSPIEYKILKVLVQEGKYMTTSEISKVCKISWNTALKYVKKFYNKKWLSKRTVGNRIYWKAIVRKT